MRRILFSRCLICLIKLLCCKAFICPGFRSQRYDLTAALTTKPSPSSTTEVGDLNSLSEAPVPPKEMVKLFGRLAEKYIALDASAGKCCYSGCSDCEFRLPGGGYRMAEQTAARPKWIPVYDQRATASAVHHSKWSTSLFSEVEILSKEEFVESITSLEYSPPLGGPYVGASAATFETTAVVERFYNILTEPESKPLSLAFMTKRLKALANGEEGITWAAFEQILTKR